MADYYLMPQKWHPSGKCEMAFNKGNWDWIRYIQTTRKKAVQAAIDYEKELNNGELFDMEILIRERRTMFSVLPVPNGQARDCNTYSRWPCNSDIFDE